MTKDKLDELPIDLVVCFLEVYFNGHKTSFNFSSLEAMQNLLDNDLIFYDPTIWDKSRLTGKDDLVKKRSYLVYQ